MVAIHRVRHEIDAGNIATTLVDLEDALQGERITNYAAGGSEPQFGVDISYAIDSYMAFSQSNMLKLISTAVILEQPT